MFGSFSDRDSWHLLIAMCGFVNFRVKSVSFKVSVLYHRRVSCGGLVASSSENRFQLNDAKSKRRECSFEVLDNVSSCLGALLSRFPEFGG